MTRTKIVLAAVVALFAFYQIFCVIVYGEVFFSNSARWVRYETDPVNFVLGVVVYVLSAAFMSVMIFAALRERHRRKASSWDHYR